jgi:hypothetical protein
MLEDRLCDPEAEAAVFGDGEMFIIKSINPIVEDGKGVREFATGALTSVRTK